jgi:hypothetical protein
MIFRKADRVLREELLPKPREPLSTSLHMPWCNVYGGEDKAPIRMLGGLDERRPSVTWYCDKRAVGRFRFMCEHGHRGHVMNLCEKHRKMYWNGVRFCPRCNQPGMPPHQCKVGMEAVS